MHIKMRISLFGFGFRISEDMIFVFLQLPDPPKPVVDFDLDSLLSDLTSFDPSSAVAASHPAPPIQPTNPIVAMPPQPMPPQPPVRSGPPSSQSTPQHVQARQVPVEPSPTPPSTPGTTPSHVPLRANTQVDRNYQPRREDPEPLVRSYSETKASPDHRRPAGVFCVQPRCGKLAQGQGILVRSNL